MVERFIREAQAATQMNHENVVKFYDFALDPDEGYYYIMEYLEGESLRTVLDRSGRLPWDETREILLQIARGLDHAPGGFRIDLELTAAALGLGTAQGKKGPLPRALHRAQTFGFARPVGTDKVAFRTRAATLTVRQLARLPHIVQAAHEGFAEPATLR